jgi:hydroxypyruvate reductase
MTRSAEKLRSDALTIWQAGVDAVRSDRLVRETVRIEAHELAIDDQLRLDLDQVRRIVVIGAGKAGAGMAAGVEQALGADLAKDKQLSGWINVPADCVEWHDAPRRDARHGASCHIHLHPARPAGVNEPTEDGERGSREILRLVEAMGPQDLCLCLISGGASALLPAPVAGISLADKLAVTRFLSAAGANIQELNTVRKQLSRIKGGGLARACRAGWLVTLIISDVIGDPLDVIGSGPTVEDASTPADALAVLDKYAARPSGQVPMAVFRTLEGRAREWHNAPRRDARRGASCHTVVIGNNAVAVDAAGQTAVRLGYSPAMSAARTLEGPAEDVGRHLAEMALAMRSQRGSDCLISGGEPVVQLVPAAQRGLGGRNQQLVLAALERLERMRNAECGMRNEGDVGDALRGIIILSGGTDGEDGPTDAAGAVIDAEIAARARAAGLDAADSLRRNDAYHFFDPVGGLVKTGPTHTNVCDVRVVLVDRGERGA